MSAWEKIEQGWHKVEQNRYFLAVEDILIFLVLTLAIHYAWRFWAYHLNYAPFEKEMDSLLGFLIHQLNLQTAWVFDHLVPVPYSFHDGSFWFPNGWGMNINGSCSGLKQIVQFGLLMVLFPGPWKHKAWFIPAGMLLLHFVNLFRLILLALTLDHIPQHVYLIHHFLLRLLFYIVIFGLWLMWIRYFYPGRSKPQPQTGNQ
ncbi:MAG TPA: archaeosortase/exosortase family protein [Bacteroidales bacterium]|nr:archaeosortase/exosortase family protein [Bacteroidales bacterium]